MLSAEGPSGQAGPVDVFVDRAVDTLAFFHHARDVLVAVVEPIVVAALELAQEIGELGREVEGRVWPRLPACFSGGDLGGVEVFPTGSAASQRSRRPSEASHVDSRID